MRGGNRPRSTILAAILAACIAAALAGTACSSVPAPKAEVALAWYDLGNAWFDKGEWKKAGEAYSRALALDPSLAGASYNFARALAEAGDYTAALKILEGLAERDPGNVRVLAAEAYALYKSGDAAAALKAYDAVLLLDPYAADAVYNSALLKSAAGEKEAAAADLARLVAVKADDAAALLLLARLRKDLGARDEAILAYEAARGLGKADPAALEQLGLLYAEARRFSEAMDSLAAATQADGKRAGAWFALARLRLSVAEDGVTGLEALNKALEAGFSDKDAAAALLAEPVLAEREAVAKLLGEKGLVPGEEPPAGDEAVAE
jgi:tetratricopeptide (TPR) repeat protein